MSFVTRSIEKKLYFRNHKFSHKSTLHRTTEYYMTMRQQWSYCRSAPYASRNTAQRFRVSYGDVGRMNIESFNGQPEWKAGFICCTFILQVLCKDQSLIIALIMTVWNSVNSSELEAKMAAPMKLLKSDWKIISKIRRQRIQDWSSHSVCSVYAQQIEWIEFFIGVVFWWVESDCGVWSKGRFEGRKSSVSELSWNRQILQSTAVFKQCSILYQRPGIYC